MLHFLSIPFLAYCTGPNHLKNCTGGGDTELLILYTSVNVKLLFHYGLYFNTDYVCTVIFICRKIQNTITIKLSLFFLVFTDDIIPAILVMF